MIITHYGKEFFKLQFGDTVIAINPVSKKSNAKTSRFGADICLISLNHEDFNGIENVSHGGKEVFIISGPGEYEVKGIFVKGFLINTEYDKDEKINTIYTLVLEGMKVCFLGALSNKDISSEIREEIGSVDILFVPIGNVDVLDPSTAHRLSVSFSPKIIIPMHYEDEKSKELKKFLDEAGEDRVKPVEKLTIKKKDISEKSAHVIVLKTL